jgi:hypothetical protein
MEAEPKSHRAIMASSTFTGPIRARKHLLDAEAALAAALGVYTPEHMPFDHDTATVPLPASAPSSPRWKPEADRHPHLAFRPSRTHLGPAALTAHASPPNHRTDLEHDRPC